MPLRLCSILGTFLLALSLAQPALAQGAGIDADRAEAGSANAKKRAKKARSRKADDGSLQSKRGKNKKKDEEEATETSTDAISATEASAEEEPLPEPDAWERPPMEEEKPPAPPPAKEIEEVAGDGKPYSVGLLAGYGFKTDRRTANFGSDPYGLGAGLRGGYSFPFELYVGLYVIYYLGTSETGDAARANDPTVTTSASYLHFGAEVGYDWWVGPLIVRPSLQLGPALAFTDNPSLPAKTVGSFMFAPGLTIVHPWDDFFLGGDLRANIVTGDGVSDVLLALTGGLRF